jgi:formate dehydrogenase subunit delta
MEIRDMVRMANQIAGFFKGYGAEEGAKETAAHINAFWEPRMRSLFFAHVDKGGEGLDPLVLAAARQVKRPSAAA